MKLPSRFSDSEENATLCSLCLWSNKNMGALFSRNRRHHKILGHHECEIFGRGLEAAESATRWRSCQKNPGHDSFIPATDFADHRLLRSLSDESREWLKVAVDRTVRLRVNWTSPDRPDDDDLSDYRGTDRLRLGTGFIRNVSDPQLNKPCPCDECDGKVKRNYWQFKLQTAHHVVYNREEAKETQVDLFYDKEDSQEKGQMKTVRAMTIVCSHYDRDFCGMTCITHDEDLGNRLLTLEKRWWGLFYTSRQPVSGLTKSESSVRNRKLFTSGHKGQIVIISHPHGQPKKITLGEIDVDIERLNHYVEYYTATCPGSSGAPVFSLYSGAQDSQSCLGYYVGRFVHGGTRRRKFRNHVNYGNRYWKK